MRKLPNTWKISTVGAVANLSSGFGFPKHEQGKSSGEYPFAKVSDITNAVNTANGVLSSAANYIDKVELKSLRAKPVPSGSTVFAKIGEALHLNRRAITNIEMVLDNNCMALSPRSDLIDAHYLYRYMQTVNLSPFAVATSVPSVRRGDVSAIEIPIPPLEEQERIVAKLESIFTKSRLARKELRHVPELVERYKQAVLAAAYRGGLTAAWRKEHADIETALSLVGRTKAPTQPRGGREAAEGIIRGVAALSVNDPGGAVPSGWAWTSLMRIARQETGHTPSRSHPEWWDGDIPWIGIKDANAHHGRVICETLQTTNSEGLENSAARLLPAGTVCLSRTASVGYVVIMGKDMATSQDFVTWTCTEALLPKYLMYALMAEGDEIRRFGKGSTHTTIYFPEVRALHICLAPLKEQQEIIDRVEAAFAHIDELADEAARVPMLLDRLDQATLAKAFRGELGHDPVKMPRSEVVEQITNLANQTLTVMEKTP